jgi:hypothetical protein
MKALAHIVVLTVAVTGGGSVLSTPKGIACKPRCALHVRRGARVVLSAHAKPGFEFSHWSAPCGTSAKCTVKMTKARTEHAYFTAVSKPPPPPPAPAPPPPPAKAGHYAGTYSDGTTFDFDVQGTSLTNLAFDFNGDCDNGGTQAGPLTTVNGTFGIGSDGSVSGHITLTYSNAAGSADFAGKLTSSGTGSGTLKISVTFSNGGPTCTSNGAWTAQDQS